jgi:hypothetical protein
MGEPPWFTATMGLPQSLWAAWTITVESPVAMATALT